MANWFFSSNRVDFFLTFEIFFLCFRIGKEYRLVYKSWNLADNGKDRPENRLVWFPFQWFFCLFSTYRHVKLIYQKGWCFLSSLIDNCRIQRNARYFSLFRKLLQTVFSAYSLTSSERLWGILCQLAFSTYALIWSEILCFSRFYTVF